MWEANHVWLIFTLVVLWTAFSEVFASITLTLFVPLSLAALGIVLRGSSFAFRKEVFRTSSRRNFGAAFALSSVLVPYCMGAIAGAIASGRVPSGGKAGDPWSSWINPTSILGGVLAVTVTAYLAATYLVFDAGRIGSPDMVEYFRRRSIAAACSPEVSRSSASSCSAPTPATSSTGSPHGRSRSSCSRRCAASPRSSWPSERPTADARLLAAGAVAAVVVAWGVAQWPYMLPESLEVSEAAAPDATLTTVLVMFGVAVALVLPSLGLLYVLEQRGVVSEADDAPAEGVV